MVLIKRIFLIVLALGFAILFSSCQQDLSFVQKPQASNNELIKRAQTYVIQGLDYYEQKNYFEAKKRFDYALDLLSRADLPPGSRRRP